jgi:hypothetical protein
MGLVLNISKVPWLISSEKERIVIADMRKMNIHGAIKNRVSKLAYPCARIFPSAKTQVNNPTISKKTMMTT